MQIGQSATATLPAFARAITLIADGLSEHQLVPLLAGCAADATGADQAAVYLHPDTSRVMSAWRLGGTWGGDGEVLAALPETFGLGAGLLAPLFQNARPIVEHDLLAGADAQAPLPPALPARSLAGLAFRRRDGHPIGVVLVASRQAGVFGDEALEALRGMARLLGIGIDNARLAAGQQRERRMVLDSTVALSTVLESVGSGVCVVELDGTLRIVNQTLQALFGLTGRTAAHQADVFAAGSIQPAAADTFQARLRELIADPSQIDESEWELATDPPRIVQRYAAPMRNQVGEVVGRVEVYTDVTEARRLYSQLLNSEKLRVVGAMAAGVAHDFNNVLASILGQTDLLHSDDLSLGMRQAISTIRHAALDGASMVRNLQGLARPRVETPSSTTDLNETVQLAVDMARPRWSAAARPNSGRIEVQVDLHAGLRPSRVTIDPTELREILLNLMFNAVDAMPQGGRIELQTRPGSAPETAEIVVRDTGSGMPEAVRSRVFEPFFSTKGPKGSGLGLAVAYSIITRRRGHIQVESEPGQGTTFTIALPYVPRVAADDSAPPAPPAARPAAPPAVAASPALEGARILVADDEPGLVAIVRQLMERAGGVVSTADGGQAALVALDAPPGTFDVVITDLDMPDVDGWAIAAAVKARTPETHVVMLTGWAGEIAPEDFKARGVDVVLAKPCSRADLVAALSALLAPRLAAAARAAPQAPPSAATGLDVLVVDDEAAFAKVVGELLTHQGHRVTRVDSAPAALDAVASHAFDVVLTDYSLGEVSGAELAERLADRPSSPFVVLLTGYAIEIDDASLLTRGVDAVLPKPCGGADLRSVLARVTRARVALAAG